MREHYHPIVLAEMEGYRQKYVVDPKKPFKFEVTSFLQKFPVYKGIQQFYLADIAKEKRKLEHKNKKL